LGGGEESSLGITMPDIVYLAIDLFKGWQIVSEVQDHLGPSGHPD